jgi:hypothetical protein
MDSGRTNAALWEISKKLAVERLGGHSARAMQLAGKLYREAGGKYTGKKTDAQKSLTIWTGRDWRTKSGKPSSITGERYLPAKAIEALSSAEYSLTTKAKRAGMKEGKQFVKQPKAIAEKTKKFRI